MFIKGDKVIYRNKFSGTDYPAIVVAERNGGIHPIVGIIITNMEHIGIIRVHQTSLIKVNIKIR